MTSETGDVEGIATQPRPSFGRSTAVMAAGTTLSRVTGFVRIAVIAWAIGATESKLPDTYQLANTLPNIVYQLILGEILVTVFVPIFVEYISTKSREETRSLSSTMFTAAFLVAALISVLAVIAAPWLIKIYSFRLQGADRQLQEEVGAFFLRLFMPQMIFYGVGMVLTGLLNANRRFAAPMFAPILNNLIVIGTFVAFRLLHGADVPTLANLTSGDKLLLGLGTTIGVAAMTLSYLPAAFRLPRWFSLRDINWRHPALRRIATLSKWALAYVVVNQIGLLVVKALANGQRGGVAVYDNSFVLYQLPYGIIAVSVFTALVPTLSEHHISGKVDSFRQDVSLGLRMTSFIVVPASAGFVALAYPLTALLLEHGVFTESSTELFADTFALMALGLGAYAAFQQMMRAFVSMQDTRTPWVANTIGVAVNIATAVPLFSIMGVPGLGLSHALSYLSAMLAGTLALSRRIGGFGKGLSSWHAKVILASVATGAAAWGVSQAIAAGLNVQVLGGQLIQVFSSIAVGLVVYLGIARLMKLEELHKAVRLAGRLVGRAG